MGIQRKGPGIDWKTYANPCKKGTFSLMCECGENIRASEIAGLINAFVTCPKCGGHKWAVFTTTPSIHDTCNHCEHDCKIPERRAPCGMYLYKMRDECKMDEDCENCILATTHPLASQERHTEAI